MFYAYPAITFGRCAMTRKFFFSLFFLCLLFSFANCKGDDDDSADDSDDDNDDNDDNDDSSDDDDDDLTLPEGWRMELVDDGDETGYDNQIALISNNNQIIYYGRMEDLPDIISLRLAIKEGENWNVDSLPFTKTGGSLPLLIDRDDHLHLSLMRFGEEVHHNILEYGNDCDGELQFETILQAEMRTVFTMAIDSANIPHFFVEGYGDLIYYLCWNGAAWDFSLFGYGTTPSMAIDNNDYLHVAFYVPYDFNDIDDDIDEEQQGKVIHYFNTEGDWSWETIDYIIDNEPIDSLDPDSVLDLYTKVDPTGAMHVGYQVKFVDDHEESQDSIYKIMYATKADGQWKRSTVHVNGWLRSFTIDDQSRPHFLVYDWNEEGLVWLTREDGESSWTSTWLGLEPCHTGLAIDADGYAHISYSPTYNEDKETIHLYYLTNRPE